MKALLRQTKLNKYVPFVLVISFTVLYASMSLLRHWHFGSSGYDLGIFDQAIWHYSNFETPASTIRGVSNLWGDHFHPILLLLAPLGWVFHGAEGLLIIQALLFALSSLPVYWFVKKRLGGVGALLITLSYLLFWGMQNAVAFDFHEIAFAVPLIACAIYFIDVKNWTCYWVSIGLLLLTKEDLSILVVFFGIFLMAKKYWKAGIISATVGLAWFFLATKLFIPVFAGSGGAYAYWTYSGIGPSPVGAIKNSVLNPLLIPRTIINSRLKLKTAWFIFNPFLLAPFFSPLIILAIPLILERFLSTNIIYWVTDFHYTATISPILAMAAGDSLYSLKKALPLLKPIRRWQGTIIILLAAFVLANNFRLAPKFPLWALHRLQYWNLSESDKAGRSALSLIPKTSSVAAQDGITPHLTHRDRIYSINGNEPSTDFIIVCTCVSPWPLADQAQIEKIVKKKLEHSYQVIYSKSGWRVLKRG